MKCDICGRDNLTEKELAVHTKYFHKRKLETYEQPQQFAQGACPDCGSVLWFEEGCANCRTCGYSRCS